MSIFSCMQYTWQLCMPFIISSYDKHKMHWEIQQMLIICRFKVQLPPVLRKNLFPPNILQFFCTIAHLRNERNREYFARFGVLCMHFAVGSLKTLPRHAGNLSCSTRTFLRFVCVYNLTPPAFCPWDWTVRLCAFPLCCAALFMRNICERSGNVYKDCSSSFSIIFVSKTSSTVSRQSRNSQFDDLG